MRNLSFIMVASVGLLVVACSDSSGSGGNGGNGNGGNGASTSNGGGGSGQGGIPSTGGEGTGGTPATGGSPGTGGSGGSSTCDGVELTVLNFDSWCSVTIGNGAPSTLGTQTVCVDANSTVDLSASAASATFIVGDAPWHNTDDSGNTSGNPPHSDTTETVTTGTDCIWVCCPFANGTGCPDADQCP